MNATSFWEWFALHSTELLLTRPLSLSADRIYAEVRKIDDRISVMISEDVSPCELIISGSGHRDLVSTIINLTEKAPEIPGWKIVAFKPARGFDFIFRSNGTKVCPIEWSFIPLRGEDNALGIRLFIPGPTTVALDNATLRTIIEIGLGEAVSYMITYLDFTQDPEEYSAEGEWIKIALLSNFLDWQQNKTGAKNER